MMHADALRLARKEWGAAGHVDYGSVRGSRVGILKIDGKFHVCGRSSKGWAAAFRVAGLLPEESGASDAVTAPPPGGAAGP
jgi:hypothetical protein